MLLGMSQNIGKQFFLQFAMDSVSYLNGPVGSYQIRHDRTDMIGVGMEHILNGVWKENQLLLEFYQRIIHLRNHLEGELIIIRV